MHTLQLKGLVDFEAELQKLQTQLDTKVDTSIKSLQDRRALPSYTTKVPPAVREADAQRLDDLTVQREGILKAIDNFRSMQ